MAAKVAVQVHSKIDYDEDIHMQKPIQYHMPQFKAACLNVNGLDMVFDGRHYSYKVPFAIQLARQTICTRLGWLCCPCCCPATGPQDSMDFVNQDTGDQVRYHRIRRKVHVFHNGQYEGFMKRTWRCCGNCRTCIDDLMCKDIPLVSLFDNNAHQFAALTRTGRGCCCICKPVFPLRCIDGKILGLPISFFGCCSCTCECWPSAARMTGCPSSCSFFNGVPTCGLPHGCLYCDPVCCECCAKGTQKHCGCTECPCCCCPNCCGCLACCCFCPVLESKELPIHSTFKYQEMDIKMKDGRNAGKAQLQYRGNVPFQSAYLHDEERPFTAAVEVLDSTHGKVSSAILVAKSYAMGAPAPLLNDLYVANRSPDYHGYVTTVRSDEVDALVDALDEDNRVTKKVYVGFKNVTGYTLIEVGYDNSWFSCGPFMIGGGESKAPRSCTNKAKAVQYIKNAREGGTRPTLTFRFYMEDPEIDIISRKLSKTPLNDKWYDFYHLGREQVYLACSCVRFCRFPCNTTIHKTEVCRIPCYQRDRPRNVEHGTDEEGRKAKAPNQVIMYPGKKVDNFMA